MAVPIIPILKKIGTAVLSNKKGRKVVGGIILGSLMLLMTPAAVVLGIFSGSMDINTDGVQTIVKDRQETEEKRYAEIEQAMTEAGYSEIKIREAQAIYSFALFDIAVDDLAQKLSDCFSAETDEELVEKINTAFGTNFAYEEIVAVLESVRQEYENERSG